MKNGRALTGHRRSYSHHGSQSARRGQWSGGWTTSCICGWTSERGETRGEVSVSYRLHLDDAIDRGLFRCRRCGEEKLATEMRQDYRWICKPCSSKLGNEWAARNPAASRLHKRKCWLLRGYGITLEEVGEILANQGGTCAICRKQVTDPRGFSPHVDHDHATGKVRGILCLTCNAGLGSFHDDPDLLRSAIRYLEEALARSAA